MKAKEKANLTIRIIEYGLEHESFTLRKLYTDLNLFTGNSITYVENILASKNLEPNPNNILGLVKLSQRQQHGIIDIDNTLYTLLPTAYFSYIELEEIKLSRENAELARKNSVLARKDAKQAIEQSQIANQHSIEANQHARSAVRLSRLAVWATVAVGVVQIVIAIMQYVKS